MPRLNGRGDLVLEVIVPHDVSWSSMHHLLAELKEAVVTAYTEAVNDPIIREEMERVVAAQVVEEGDEAVEDDEIDGELVELMN